MKPLPWNPTFTRIELPKPSLLRACVLFPMPGDATPADIWRINKLRADWLRARAYVDDNGLEPSVGIGIMHGAVAELRGEN